MFLPQSLSQRISESFLALRANPYYDLTLGYRQAIWAALGPDDGMGHKWRSLLAISTARSVLSVWEAMYPLDTRPKEVLIQAENLFYGSGERSFIIANGGALWQWLELSIGVVEDVVPLYAGTSAYKALCVALQDERFAFTDIDFQRTDADIDVYDLDCSYFAACAYASGSIWESRSDPIKRLAFWEWWLQEAISDAWTRCHLLP